MAEIKGEQCALCGEKKLTLRDEEIDVPHFGRLFVLTMECEGCGYKKSDIEPAERKEPCRYVLEVTSEADMSIKIVKSGDATVKIPQIITIDPGPAANGYITNIEGLLEKVKEMIHVAAASEDEDDGGSAMRKAKNMLKKLDDVILGRDSLKIILEDPTGYSAIISKKAVKSKL